MSRGDVLALLLCMTCAASVAGLATIVASPGPASPRFPLRLKGGGAKPQVSRCESGNAAGGTNIVESAEMAALNHCHQTITIDATPEECFAAASGFEDYPKWAGAMKKVNVKKRQGRGLGTVVEWTMGILNLVDRPIFVYTYGRSYTEMKWHIQTPSKTIKNLEGRYTFKAVGSAKAPKTQVEYKLNVEPYIPFPTFVKKVINKAVANQALKELKRYTEKQRTAARAGAAAGGEAPQAEGGLLRFFKLSLFGCFGAK